MAHVFPMNDYTGSDDWLVYVVGECAKPVRTGFHPSTNGIFKVIMLYGGILTGPVLNI